MDENMAERPSTASEWENTARETRAKRKSYLFSLPSGNRVEILKIELIEALPIYKLMGISLENKDKKDMKEILGIKLLENLTAISDRFLPMFIKSPRIYPSKFEGKIPEGGLSICRIDETDQISIIVEILNKVTPGGAKAKAEGFPGEPSDKNGEPARP